MARVAFLRRRRVIGPATAVFAGGDPVRAPGASTPFLTITGLTDGEARLGSHASLSVAFPIGVTAWTSQKWGVAADDDLYGTGANPTDYTASDGLTLLWEGVGSNGKTYRARAPIRRAPGTFGALSNQTFTAGVEGSSYLFAAATGTGLTWTYTLVSPPAGVSIVSATRTIGFAETMPPQVTVITVRASDQYGRAIDRTFTLTLNENIAVNPTVSSDTFTAGGTGTPDAFTITGAYTGSDTLILEAVLGTNPITVSATQLTNQSGGTNTLGFFTVDPFVFGDTFDIAGLTSASEAATRIAYQIREKNNGGTSGVITPPDVISGLDFTAPVFSSAETTSNTVIRVTMNSPLFGSTAAAQWTLTGNTIASVAFTPGNAFVDLTVGTTILSTDNYTGDLSFSGTALVDGKGNPLATFTGRDVTNNVVGTGVAFRGQTTFSYAPFAGNETQVISLTGLSLQPNDVVILGIVRGSGTTRAATVSGWTVIADLFANATRDTNADVFLKVMGATPDPSVTVGLAANGTDSATVIIQAYSGVNTTTPMDVTATTATGINSITANPPSITPVTTGARIVVFAGATYEPFTDNPMTASYLTNVTAEEFAYSDVVATNSVSALMGSVGWTGGAYDPAAVTITGSASGNSWAAVTMALRPA